MNDRPAINTLFLDIGGVLLTNGWDHHARKRAADHFGLNYEDMNERHNMTFGVYEEGKSSLDDYLRRVVFHTRREFTPREFREFMFAQSQPLAGALEFFLRLKSRFRLRVAAVSNEGHELTLYRVRQFRLRELMDFFICSCFVHCRKPDATLYRLALDVAQADPARVAYLDDRKMFADVACEFGVHGIHHEGLESTREALAGLGLALEDGTGEGE